MPLAETVDANSAAREGRQSMTSSASSLAQRLARSMGPGTDDSQFRQRMTILLTLTEKLVANDSGGTGVRRFTDALGLALPRNTAYIRATMSHHPLRRILSSDMSLQTRAVDLGDGNGPLWDLLRSALLAPNRDSMLGSLSRLYEDGTAESAGAMRPTVTEFFNRLAEVDSTLHTLVTSGTARWAGSGLISVPAAAVINYTNGPTPGDTLVGSAGRVDPRTTMTGGGSSVGSTGGYYPVPDIGGAGGGAMVPYAGGGTFSSDAGLLTSSSEAVLRKARLLRRIAQNMGIGIPALVRALVDLYTLWVLMRRGSSAMGISAAPDDDVLGTATIRELHELGALASDTREPMAPRFVAPGDDPVRSTFPGVGG